jgi:hypothetical protein
MTGFSVFLRMPKKKGFFFLYRKQVYTIFLPAHQELMPEGGETMPAR